MELDTKFNQLIDEADPSARGMSDEQKKEKLSFSNPFLNESIHIRQNDLIALTTKGLNLL